MRKKYCFCELIKKMPFVVGVPILFQQLGLPSVYKYLHIIMPFIIVSRKLIQSFPCFSCSRWRTRRWPPTTRAAAAAAPTLLTTSPRRRRTRTKMSSLSSGGCVSQYLVHLRPNLHAVKKSSLYSLVGN